MSSRINMSSIELAQLNNASLVLMASFVGKLADDEGTLIRLQDKDVMRQIVTQAKKTKNPQLLDIYANLKAEIKSYLNSGLVNKRTISELRKPSNPNKANPSKDNQAQRTTV